MNAAAQERSAYDQALDRFATGTATRDDVQTLADECVLPMVQIHVRRREPPPHGQPIELLPGGPQSLEGKPVVHVDGPRWGGVWAAWWSSAEIREWLEHTEPRP